MGQMLILGMILLQTMRLDPSDDVRAAVEKFGQAYVAADVEVLGSLLADPYLHVNGGTGTVLNEASWLAWIETRREALDDGSLVIETYEVEDLVIRMRRDSAIVLGIVRSTGVENGVAFDTAIRFSNLWVLEGEDWKRALFHDSVLPRASD
jgi:ketosteroid isomerase-like protein